ncbi:MAG: protein translocase SEC61 complex subunit gamma [Nanoarchaeota archaeon]|nr:protein translocase SEC61 complex subunit gamma [Nanoarchaeota archaeon]
MAIKQFISKSLRVWRVLKKPSSMEFKTIAKVSAIGILIIGFIGFIITIALSVF